MRTRPVLYPEGSATLNLFVPAPVKQGLRTVAERNRQSVSQLVTIILEDWLKRRGEFPLPERVPTHV